MWYNRISFSRINSTVTWCLVAPLHICKSLHGWLVRGQGTLVVVLTKGHLVTNVKKLWTSRRAGVFCGFEGAVWDTYSSLRSGQSHRPTWCILTFSFCRGNFCLLLITNYSCWFNLFGVMTFSQLTWSAVRRNCEGIVFEILGTIEPAARGCKEGIGNSSKTKHISRAPGAVILVGSLCIWLILDFRLGLREWLYL